MDSLVWPRVFGFSVGVGWGDGNGACKREL